MNGRRIGGIYQEPLSWARCAHVVLLLTFVLAGSVILPGQADAAGPAPSWGITLRSYPTRFEPNATAALNGPGYLIGVTNVGGAPTAGSYEITDLLPAGLTPVQIFAKDSRENLLTCSSAGSLVTCEGSEPVEAGGTIEVIVRVSGIGPAGTRLTDEATVSGGEGGSASAVASTSVADGLPPFGILSGSGGLVTYATESDGEPATRAGSHPYELTIGAGFPIQRFGQVLLGIDGGLKDFDLRLPRGQVVNPQASPERRTEAQLETEGEGFRPDLCPAGSQVGTVAVTSFISFPLIRSTALYNMVPEEGTPAEFAFQALGLPIYVHLFGHLTSDGGYVLSARTPNILSSSGNPVLAFQAELWGDPTDESHDDRRPPGCTAAGIVGGCATPPRSTVPFLTQPSACSGALRTTAGATSWADPGTAVEASVESISPRGAPVGIEGCSALDFAPGLKLEPTENRADTPTGLKVHLHLPQSEAVDELATADLKDATVRLPEGLTINPSAADGLAACTEGQVGVASEHPVSFDESPTACPDASKIGTVEVDTPLLDHPLPGSIYVAQPYGNPFGSLLAIYLAVEDPASGVILKLAGHVVADPETGRLTATFEENPQLPFEDFRLDFFGGPRAALRTPTTCGSHDYKSELSPWSGTAPVDSTGSFSTGPAANGACASSEAGLPNSPSFEAGMTNQVAGAYSPFVLHLKRDDGTQTIKALNVNLPPGLLGKLAGIPYCPDAALTSAATKSGEEEKANSSCPASSEIGKVTVGAGAGPQPYYVAGRAYLAGPYKGAPLSLAIVTPAVAGPYDLGTVVVRSALYVNQETAQISVKSDPIPTILEGIPLDVRSISVELDRNGFTRNPTNCEAMAIGAESISPSGQAAQLASTFQVGGCKGLAFAPKLKLQVIGKTNRNAKPRLKAVLTTKPGEADIRRAQVNLPHSMFLEQSHIKTVCTRVQWAEGNGNGSACPRGSIYGRAMAWTPLLDHPLEGYVYLRSNGGDRKLPDMVAGLNGQVSIALWGKVDSGPNKGLRNTFEVVPDAPVERFVLELNGKKKGLLVNSEELCAKGAKRNAIVRFTGQNGKVAESKPKVATSCPKPKKSGKGGKK